MSSGIKMQSSEAKRSEDLKVLQMRIETPHNTTTQQTVFHGRL